MRGFFAALAALSLLLALGTCAVSKGAVHEIEAQIWILIAVVAIACHAIIRELERNRPPPPPK